MENRKSVNNIDKMILKKKTNYDVIERKDLELNNIREKTNDIKTDSIKQFIYSNKNIPKVWKTKKNFKNLVLQIFADDDNFIKYLGNNTEYDSNITTNTNTKRPMTSKLEERKIKNLSFNRYQPPKRKIRMSINPQTEMENIFDDLKEKYPIKNKLIQLFPYYNFDEKKSDKKISYSFNNYSRLKNSKLVENSVAKKKLRKIKKMEKNIYNNLFPINKFNTPIATRMSKNQNIDFEYKRKNRIKLMQKELNDPKVFNLLNSLNLYGPYFSYCPYCYEKNIDFYKNIGKKQCISLLNYIKDDNNKQMELRETKFRKNLKQNTNFF